MANKESKGNLSTDEKKTDQEGKRSEVAAGLGQTEQIGHDEERYRRNQEWSPTQDSEYQTGGGPHSEEDAEAATKAAESGS